MSTPQPSAPGADSRDYAKVAAQVYRSLTGFEERGRVLEVKNLQQLYTVVFGALSADRVSALRMAKFVAIIGKAFHVKIEHDRTPFLTTIWLYGTEPVKDTQVLKRHSILAKSWAEGATPAYRYIRCRDPSELSKALDRFPSMVVKDIAGLLSSLDTLSDGYLISIAYDFLLERPFVDGRQNFLTEGEALSDLSLSTIVKNAWEVRRFIQRRPIDAYRAALPIAETTTQGWECVSPPDPNVMCLKNGTCNPLVVYLACLTLDTLGVGVGRHNQHLWRVLSCRLLSAELAYRYRLRIATETTHSTKAELETRMAQMGERGAPSKVSQFSWNQLCRLYRDVAHLSEQTARNTKPVLTSTPACRDLLDLRDDTIRITGLPRQLNGQDGSEWRESFLKTVQHTVKRLESLRESFSLDPGLDYLVDDSLAYSYGLGSREISSNQTSSDWDRWTAAW